MSVDYRPNYDPADVDSDYGHTGGDITVPTFTANMKPFRFWCQKALPLVYDDSLSYYEVLCKVVKQMNDFLTDLQTATGAIDQFAQQFVINQQFLNEMADQLGQNIEDLETYINERMTDFMTAYTQLQDYVNNYFDNLDVQQEINNKLDEMASDGTFNDLFDPVITAWMTAKTAQINAAIAGQDAIQAQQNGRISVLEGRMDTFSSLPSGSTSGNAELLDIRTNFLGEVYPTAGEAVRASDMIASGFQSISATKLEEWDGNDESSVYDSIQIDIGGYKGGHVVVIGSFKYFQSDLNNTGSCAVYATNTPGEVEDANAVNYLPGTTNSIFTNFTQITTSISGEERLLLQFAIPDDFSYQYLKIGHFEHNPVSGNYTEPLYIVYANSWSKTQVDPTLSITGDAADAKATGDALDELNERLPIVIADTATLQAGNLILYDTITPEHYVNAGTGELVENNSWNASDFISIRPGETYNWIGVSNATFAFYDINKQYVDLRSNANVCEANKLKETFTVPDNIFYIRVSIHVSNIDYACISAITAQIPSETIYKKIKNIDGFSYEGMNAQAALKREAGFTKLNPKMYMQGSFEGLNLKFSLYHIAKRAMSKYVECYPFDIKLTPDNSTTIIAYLFDENGTVTATSVTYTKNPIRIPKNTNFMLCMDKNVDDTVENICKGVTVEIPVDIIDNVPAYYFENGYISNKVDTIISKSPLDGLQFAFLTDVHCRQNAGVSPSLITYIKNNSNAVPFVIFGGDVLVSTVDEGVDVLEDARIWQGWMEEMNKHHVYQVQGNHDYLGYHYVDGERVGFQEPLGVCRQFVIGNLEDANIVGVPGKLWYYLDIPTANTRIIFLNDYDTPRNDGVFYGYNGMSVDQVRWVVENALDVDGIRVIFVSHQTYDAEMEGENQQVFVGMQSLFTAIANHTAYSYGPIVKDFTNSTIQFVAHLCGHMHADASNINNGVLTIQTTCDGIMRSNAGRTSGTITEQAFDIVTVDYTNGKLHTTRIGYGSDREFNLT